MKRCALLLALLLLWLTPLQAKDLVLSEEAQWNFAQSLYDQGQYYRAITEWMRLNYFFPQGARQLDASRMIAQAYLAGNEPKAAISHLQQLPASREKDLLLGLAYLELEKGQPFSQRSTSLQLALEHLQASQNPRALAFVETYQNTPAPPFKNPWIAASLSALLPGAGSVYLGRNMEALYSFTFTTLSISATLEAQKLDRRDLSAGFGILALAFYGGSIYTALNSTHKLNDYNQDRHLQAIRQREGFFFHPQGILIQRNF